MSKKQEAVPMDPSIRETVTGAAATNNQRVCWAIKTLVREVDDLFPEVPVEYSNHDGRNTALDVKFDLTVLDPEDFQTLAALLELIESDSRVNSVIVGGPGVDAVLVSFSANPRTQDSREPFGLADALSVLAEDAQ